jgi:hypothetical protein
LIVVNCNIRKIPVYYGSSIYNVGSVTVMFKLCYSVYYVQGYAKAQLVEALRYKPEGRGFDSQLCLWNSGPTMALGSTQPLTEMSTGNISCGVKAAGA